MFGTLMTQRPRPLRALRNELEEMMGRLWGEPTEVWGAEALAAPVDVAETDRAFELRMDAPAMTGKDFDIQVHGNVVTIQGERKEEKEEKGKTWHRVERRTGKFARTVTLPCEVNEETVAAEYEQGVLHVTLPKAESARPKKVAVSG
jgi:HSP20 family protein